MNRNRFAVSPYLLALVVAFSLMFFHTIFLANDDHLLVGLLSIDPGIIVHGIQSLFGQPVYNQFNSYGSTAYGWFFNDLNFLVILILKFLGQLLGYYDQPIFTAVYDQPLFNGAIRAVTFMTALFSVLMFFQVSNLLFNNRKLSFIVTLFFMFVPFGSKFAYFIHPDVMGMLLMLIAIRYLLLFIKQKPKAVYFYLSFVSLVLATLTKQSFLFISVPILLMFLSAYCRQTQVSCLKFIGQTRENL